MRILALTNLYPTPYQGTRATFNRQQFKEIAARHEIRVIAPIAWTDEWTARRAGNPALANRNVICEGIQVHHPRYLFTPRIMRSWYGHFFRWSVARSFHRAVEEFKPDVIYSCWAYPDGLAATVLARKVGLPVVIKVVGSDVLLAKGCGLNRVAETLRQADGIVAVSQDLFDHVVKLGVDPQRVRVVYSGVNTQSFRPGDRHQARDRLNLSRDVPTILFIGNLVRVKGVDVLMDACERLARERIRFDCYLVGQGTMQQDLQRRAAAISAWVRIKLIGALPHSELPDWFRAANVFVLPSRSEGVPNVLLEAAACGIPFIATRVGGIPEIANVGPGELIPPEDPAALATALQSALEKPCGQSANAGRKFRSHADAAGEILHLLQDVIDEHEQRRSAQHLAGVGC